MFASWKFAKRAKCVPRTSHEPRSFSGRMSGRMSGENLGWNEALKEFAEFMVNNCRFPCTYDKDPLGRYLFKWYSKNVEKKEQGILRGGRAEVIAAFESLRKESKDWDTICNELKAHARWYRSLSEPNTSWAWAMKAWYHHERHALRTGALSDEKSAKVSELVRALDKPASRHSLTRVPLAKQVVEYVPISCPTRKQVGQESGSDGGRPQDAEECRATPESLQRWDKNLAHLRGFVREHGRLPDVARGDENRLSAWYARQVRLADSEQLDPRRSRIIRIFRGAYSKLELPWCQQDASPEDASDKEDAAPSPDGDSPSPDGDAPNTAGSRSPENTIDTAVRSQFSPRPDDKKKRTAEESQRPGEHQLYELNGDEDSRELGDSLDSPARSPKTLRRAKAAKTTYACSTRIDAISVYHPMPHYAATDGGVNVRRRAPENHVAMQEPQRQGPFVCPPEVSLSGESRTGPVPEQHFAQVPPRGACETSGPYRDPRHAFTNPFGVRQYGYPGLPSPYTVPGQCVPGPHMPGPHTLGPHTLGPHMPSPHTLGPHTLGFHMPSHYMPFPGIPGQYALDPHTLGQCAPESYVHGQCNPGAYLPWPMPPPYERLPPGAGVTLPGNAGPLSPWSSHSHFPAAVPAQQPPGPNAPPRLAAAEQEAGAATELETASAVGLVAAAGSQRKRKGHAPAEERAELTPAKVLESFPSASERNSLPPRCSAPQTAEIEAGAVSGRTSVSQQRAAKAGREAKTGPVDKRWMKCYDRLVKYIAENGRMPRTRDRPVGKWCAKQRHLQREGELSADKFLLLDRLSGWHWERRAVVKWNRCYELLLDYVEEHGEIPSPPPIASRSGSPRTRTGGELGVAARLGLWCRTQKLQRAAGQLPAEHVHRLGRIGCWSWDDIEEPQPASVVHPALACVASSRTTPPPRAKRAPGGTSGDQ